MGAAVDPFASYSMSGSLDFTEGIAGHMLELFPSLSQVRVLRQWAGLCDMTPDYSPIMGFTPVITSYSIHYTKLYDVRGTHTGRNAQYPIPAARINGIAIRLSFIMPRLASRRSAEPNSANR